MAIRVLIIVLASVALVTCTMASSMPSETAAQLPIRAATGSGQVTVTRAEFWRDDSPRPGVMHQLRLWLGLDVGTALGGATSVLVENTSAVSATFTIKAMIYDVHGNAYPVDSVAMYETATGQAWNGTITALAQYELLIYLDTSSYHPAGTKVFARLTWTDQQRQHIVVRTEVTPIIVTS